MLDGRELTTLTFCFLAQIILLDDDEVRSRSRRTVAADNHGDPHVWGSRLLKDVVLGIEEISISHTRCLGPALSDHHIRNPAHPYRDMDI